MDIKKDYISVDDISEKIEVRSEPHIYGFTTTKVPGYVKVGDTFRPIEKRLDEWRSDDKYGKEGFSRIFPEQNEEMNAVAMVDDKYFRDYEVHKYLLKHGKTNLSKKVFDSIVGVPDKLYFSNEFYKNVSDQDIKDAINDIKTNQQNYNFYYLATKKPYREHWQNDKDWEPRDNQKVVIDNFYNKVSNSQGGKAELLMYAVMRFGKSFTSMCCAEKMGYSKILVVSAKADVANEWKKTVEMPSRFKDYAFLCDKNLVDAEYDNINIIDEILNKGEERAESVKKEFGLKNKVVVFLTLQNLSGKYYEDVNGKRVEKRKEKLQAIVNTHFDMVIIDETHYGAWARSYGAPLSKEEKEADENSNKEQWKSDKEFKETVETKIDADVRLHLSGTPYNLLYDQKFTADNMIATCKFTDILNDKEQWLYDHQKDIDNGEINPETGKRYEYFDNPYFGFPKMLRFAFNLPQETQNNLLDKLNEGHNWTLNKFLEPKGYGENAVFKNEDDVLKLLKAIDSSKNKQDNILSFLDIPKIKNNDICKHIVIVLPFKSCCDAMENLLINKKDEFEHLKDYEILNITGHKNNAYTGNNGIENVKNKITEIENRKEGKKKSITLTVNKMLTGVTVPEWDTMIMLKDTKSAQEYDQAIFRIQNQYVKEYIDDSNPNDIKTMKIDMKPQTILVDFNPVRMFEIQGTSIKIVNDLKNGDSQEKLLEAIEKEMTYFPAIACNADKLVEVNATNIIKIIADYNQNISILESSDKVDLDIDLIKNSDILDYILKQPEKGISTSLKGKMHDGDATQDIDVSEDDEIEDNGEDLGNNNNTNSNNNISSNPTKKDKKKYLERYKKCIARLMFYAFLTKSDVNSLQEIVNSVEIENDNQIDNIRIFNNLELDMKFIKVHIKYCKKLYAFDIDEAISRVNLLSQDEDLEPEVRVKNALSRFSRISESEVVTFERICDKMFNVIGKDEIIKIIDNGEFILDIASKTGEYAVSLINLFKDDEVYKNKVINSFYCIPTSPITYEFTRRVFEILGIPPCHIAKANYDKNGYLTDDSLTSYSLLKMFKRDKNGKQTKELDYDSIIDKITNGKIFNKQGDVKMKFGAVVGNPPYQENDGGGTGSSAKSLYDKFFVISKKLTDRYVSLIMKSNWMTGGKGLSDFRKETLSDKSFVYLEDFVDSKECFNGAEIEWGVCYFLWDKEHNKECKYAFNGVENYREEKDRFLDDYSSELFIRSYKGKTIVDKIQKESFESFSELVMSRNYFKTQAIKESDLDNTSVNNYRLHYILNKHRVSKYIKNNNKVSFEDKYNFIGKYKVFISKADGAAGFVGTPIPAKVIGDSIPGDLNDISTETFLAIGPFETDIERNNCIKYLKTRFARFLIGLIKQKNMSKDSYQLVPLQDFNNHNEEEIKNSNGKLIDWNKTIDEIDEQLFSKYELSKDDDCKFIKKMIKQMD